jgi:adenylate kinase
MTRILVTGVSGLGREEFFLGLDRGGLPHFDLGQLMGDVARDVGVPFSHANVLRAPTGTLTALRAAAIEAFKQAAPAGGATPVVISANAIFMLTDRVIEGLSFADVTSISPSMMVTLIDSPQRIHDRLKEHVGEYFHLTVESIVRWQELEVFFSNQMARIKGIPHFVVPVNQPDTFVKIASGDKRLIVYVSYPMTHLPDEKRPLVRQFVRRLSEKCIVFDPSSIDSSHDNKPYYTASDYRAIHNHTIVRDLDWFIGINSEAVVAYWPSLVFSSGMNDELKYAYETGRDTYLVAEAIEDANFGGLSPFTTYKSKIFGSSDDFFEFLELSSDMEKDAFLIIQGEVFSAVHMKKETGYVVSPAEFRRMCDTAVKNSLPDDFITMNHEILGSMADKMYQRWSKVLIGG